MTLLLRSCACHYSHTFFSGEIETIWCRKIGCQTWRRKFSWSRKFIWL